MKHEKGPKTEPWLVGFDDESNVLDTNGMRPMEAIHRLLVLVKKLKVTVRTTYRGRTFEVLPKDRHEDVYVKLFGLSEEQIAEAKKMKHLASQQEQERA